MWKLTIAIIAFLFFLSVNTNNAFASICGDGICNTSPPNAEWVSCPQDCPLNNTILISQLSQQVSPIVAGLPVSMLTGGCTLGSIFNISGTFYGVIANHCTVFYINFSGNYLQTIEFNDVYLEADNSIIGEVVFRDSENDIALIKFNVIASSTDFLNNTIDCFAGNYSNNASMIYYKIGRTTGLTFGNILSYNDDHFNITSINNATIIVDFGDSGSSIISTGEPRISYGIVQTFEAKNDFIATTCFSTSPFKIVDVLDMLPVCDSRPSKLFNISVFSPITKRYYKHDNIWFNITVDTTSVDICILSLGTFLNRGDFLGGNFSYANYTMTNSSGNWNYNTTLIDNGYYSINYFCNDTVGNIVEKHGTDFAVNIVPILINITLPDENSYYDTDNMWFNFTIINATANMCFIKLNDSTEVPMMNSSGNWHYNTTLSIGYYYPSFWCNITDLGITSESFPILRVRETPLYIEVLYPELPPLPVQKFRNTENMWFNITFGRTPADTCLIDVGYGYTPMMNSSGNWHYNITLQVGTYRANFWCNDSRGFFNTYKSNRFIITDFYLDIQSIAGNLIINLGLGIAGLFSILTLTYIGYQRKDPHEFIYIMIVMVIIITMIVSVWQGLVLPP